MADITLTPEQQKELAWRISHMLVANHNFLVDFLRARKIADIPTSTNKIAAAVDELVKTVVTIYPNGADKLRSDVVDLGSLVGIEVQTMTVSQASAVIH